MRKALDRQMLFAIRSIPQLKPGPEEGLDLLRKPWCAESSVHDGNGGRIKECPIPWLVSRRRRGRCSRVNPLMGPAGKPKRSRGRQVEFPMPDPTPDTPGNVMRALPGALSGASTTGTPRSAPRPESGDPATQ